jgi:hypothetical protein
VSDRALATLLGAALFVVAGWPLLVLWMPPYQDLPDHLATACVLLHPERFPEYTLNGLLRANALMDVATLALAKSFGVIAAGRVVAIAVVAATAMALPHFVLSFTDRRRMLVASLFLAPMVHHWWILMGMLGFALAVPLALGLLVHLARQAARPTWTRTTLVAIFAVLLWYTHAVVLLLVALLAGIEALVRPGTLRDKARQVAWLVGPLVPALALTAATLLAHASHAGTSRDPHFGRLADVFYQDSFSAVYDLWAHWQLGMSPLSAAGIVTAVVLVFFALRDARAPVPLFSPWAAAALFALYWFLPHMLPGFGYVDERVLPLLWAWALVRVPAHMPVWLGGLLAASSALWAAGTAADLFRAEHDLDAFTSAAPDVPEGARLLTLNFASRVSTTNTWSLLHASGMFTVLRRAHPQDLWADSPTMALRHTEPPALIEDPVRIRDLLAAARTPEAYCASLVHAGLPDDGCEPRYRSMWRGVWEQIEGRYDDVVLWGAPPEFLATVPPSFTTRVDRGKVRLLVKAATSRAP